METIAGPPEQEPVESQFETETQENHEAEQATGANPIDEGDLAAGVDPEDMADQAHMADPAGDMADPADMPDPADMADPADMPDPADMADMGDLTDMADIGDPADMADLGDPASFALNVPDGSGARSRSRTPPRDLSDTADTEDLFPPVQRTCRFCGNFTICEFGREENFCSRNCYNQSMKGCDSAEKSR